MLDQITHLFRLRTILEEGSLRRAAEKLNVTQPALSRSLAQLEAHFGQQLVERHARGVKATPFGERVLVVSSRIMRYWDIAENELRSDATSEKTRLKIGAGPVWRSGILSDIFVRMQERFPRLVIELTPLTVGSVYDDLSEGRQDVVFSGLALEREGPARLVRLKLAEVSNRIMAREGHPIFGSVASDGTIPAAELLRYPWVIYSDLPIYRETTKHALYERLGREPEVRLICQNLLSALTMLQQSDSLCVLPDLLTLAARAPRILPLPVSINPRTAEIGMLYRDELRDWEPVQVLVALCRKKFGAAPGSSV